MPTALAVEPAFPPRLRAECIDGPRPCPWTACRYHLEVERRGRNALGGAAAQETCALDLADRGHMRLQEIADVLGVTRERVRQIEVRAMVKLASEAQHLAEYLTDAG